jgi:hypothetical protein
MKTNFRQHEILLMVNSGFSGRKLSVKNVTGEHGAMVQIEELKKACWNGLVQQTLPECFEFKYDQSTFLWEITEANFFINLEYGEFYPSIEKEQSVNPYLFMQIQNYN